MFIDMHVHVRKVPGFPREGKQTYATPAQLLERYDAMGVERAVMLPGASPECSHGNESMEEVLEIARDYVPRFIPFCNVDPRIGTGDNTAQIHGRLKEHRDAGCKGYGEAMSGLYVDDERLQRVYRACGELHLPIIFHFDGYRNMDDRGLPRLERMLRAYPDTVFVGHGQHFWAEISGDVREEDFSAYPPGPVAPGGAVVRLMSAYPNLYADLSANSALNALTRDAEFGYRFVDERQDRLLFGTDACLSQHATQVPLIVEYLRSAALSGRIGGTAIRKISCQNAIRVFELDG